MKKYILILIMTALVLCSCGRRDENNTSEIQSSADNSESSTQSVSEQSEKPQTTDFKPMEKNDEAWWWQNYISQRAYDYQMEYPTNSSAKNQFNELREVMRLAYQKGLAEMTERSFWSAKLEDLQKLAPEALGKKDLSHIYTDFLTDENGVTTIYVQILSEENYNESGTGDWAFTVTKVEYTDDYTAEITVETDSIERVFTFVQSSKDVYRLVSVSENFKNADSEEVKLEFTSEIPAKTYSNYEDSLLNNEYNILMLDENRILDVYEEYFIGICEFAIKDVNDLEKEPEKLFHFLLKKDESTVGERFYINSKGNLIITTNKRIAEVSVKDGSIIKEVPVGKNYLHTDFTSWGNNYVVDEDLNYMAYASEEGVFVENLNDGKAIKVCDTEPSKFFLSANVIEIKDGILTYLKNEYYDGLDRRIYFDIEKGCDVEPELKIPHPKTENFVYKRIIGDKAIGDIMDGRMSSNYWLETYNINTGEVKQIPNRENYNGLLITDSEVYVICADRKHTELRKINLDTGLLDEPIFTAESGDITFKQLGDKIMVDLTAYDSEGNLSTKYTIVLG